MSAIRQVSRYDDKVLIKPEKNNRKVEKYINSDGSILPVYSGFMKDSRVKSALGVMCEKKGKFMPLGV